MSKTSKEEIILSKKDLVALAIEGDLEGIKKKVLEDGVSPNFKNKVAAENINTKTF
jgi:hypothetical protein